MGLLPDLGKGLLLVRTGWKSADKEVIKAVAIGRWERLSVVFSKEVQETRVRGLFVTLKERGAKAPADLPENSNSCVKPESFCSALKLLVEKTAKPSPVVTSLNPSLFYQQWYF